MISSAKTLVFLDLLDDNNYVMIGGQRSHTRTVTRGVIPVTNKSAGEAERFLNGKGPIDCNLSMELLFSSDSAFIAMRDACAARTFVKLRIVRPLFDDEDISGIVSNFVETSTKEIALTASMSIDEAQDSSLNALSGKLFPQVTPIEIIGDIYWPLGEASGNVVAITSGAEVLTIAGSPTFLQSSLRSDSTGTSIAYNAFIAQAHRITTLSIRYDGGFTIEAIARITALTFARQAQFSGDFNGRIGYVVSSKATSFTSSAWTMRFDNWDDVPGQSNIAVPVFTLLSRTLYGWYDAYSVGDAFVAEVRGTTPVVLGNTYSMIATIRNSDNTIEFWVNGVSQGSASFPALWYDYSNGVLALDGNSLLDATRNTTINVGLDAADSVSVSGGNNVQDVKIHLLEADDAFAENQASFVNFT